MTIYYSTNSWTSQPQVSESQINFWKQVSEKKNWRIVQLPNGYYQAECADPCDCAEGKPLCDCKFNGITRRETIKACEAAIDASIEHYQKRLEFLKGPKVVKTF